MDDWAINNNNIDVYVYTNLHIEGFYVVYKWLATMFYNYISFDRGSS